MKRDMVKKAEQGRKYMCTKHGRADMTAEELKALLEVYENAPEGVALYDVITTAFYSGVMIGAGLEGRRA